MTERDFSDLMRHKTDNFIELLAEGHSRSRLGVSSFPSTLRLLLQLAKAGPAKGLIKANPGKLSLFKPWIFFLHRFSSLFEPFVDRP
jgi:hypothetical protein